jgi:uncharacterized repeat protein (TIGR01451 family)
LEKTEQVASAGESLRFKIRYQNAGSVPATGVNITATLDSKALDFATFQSDAGQISGNVVTWNASGTPSLENLSPNESGDLAFSIRVKNPPVKDSSKNLTVKSTLQARAAEYPNGLPGNELIIKISTQTSISGSVEFVSGSLPPKVGESSSYKVSLSVRNTTNELTGAVLSAFTPLGSGSFVSGSVNTKESPQVNFSPSTGKLTWQAGSIPAHTGDFSPLRTMSFILQLTPSESSAGQYVTLLKDINFSATDSFTGQKINLTLPPLTTANAPEGQTQGRVRP